jgi:DNA replication and repair protein RecF
MTLEKLILANFRNFERVELNLSSKVNLVLGDNGQGKTNILEAIHLLSTTRSFRTSRDADLIRFGEKVAYVSGRDVEIAIQPGEKLIKLGGKLARAAEVLGEVRSVIFAPQDMSLLSGSPQGRRAFLDELIAKVDRKYLLTLLSYNRILKQRNRQLWLVREGRSRIDSLTSWDDLMVRDGLVILHRRLEVADKLQGYLGAVTEQLVGEVSFLRYVSKVPASQIAKEEIRRAFLERLELTRSEEIRVASSLTGPHRDDFEMVVEDKNVGKRGRGIGRFGSRGEQRSAILALKLAEVSFNEQELGTRPILLLDDVLSELDDKHREKILQEVGKQQTVITGTSSNDFPESILRISRTFGVLGGAVRLSEL